jgi:hypothetical protein
MLNNAPVVADQVNTAFVSATEMLESAFVWYYAGCWVCWKLLFGIPSVKY